MRGTKDQRAPFRYVLMWKKGENERIAVEARYRNFLKGRGKEEVLELGWVEGHRCALLQAMARSLEQRYPGERADHTVLVDLPDGPGGEDLGRRMALLATTLREAPESAALDRAYGYLESASSMEINFWMSKLMDQDVGAERVVPALLLISRSMRVRPSGQ